ncbi:hypothetical protein GCM10010401_14010 [Rarobacter faecitabidus]|uniref:hypothetical protein n=1 Tax=Rarobacter faecitabidus TaxID=13243 RepID=UPI00114F733E|nr:hypothetical protein [Rarobacter faecitabidus]
MSARQETQCKACGRAVVMLLVMPLELHPGSQRQWAPFEPEFVSACGIRPSHAVQIGSSTARVLPATESPDPTERPALIHFAVCPARTALSGREAAIAG